MVTKICMITTWHQRCGIASYSADLVEALAQQDVEIYVLRQPRFGQKTVELFQAQLDSIPKDAELIHVQHEYGLYQGLDAPFYEMLRDAAKGRPIVTTMHGVGSAQPGIYEISQRIEEVSTKLIVHNEFCRQYFRGAETIPHGCKPSKTMPMDQAKEELKIQTDAPVVGYLGYISPWKGIEALIQAMLKIEKAGLLLAGGELVENRASDYMVRLKQYTLDRLHNRCQWTGFVPDEKLPTVYGAMDIVVYPSRFMSESGAMLMALSFGKAVIATSLPPTEEKARQGVLATFKDVNDLAEKITELLKDESARKELENNARKYCETNSWLNIGERHKALYGSLLNRETPA